MAQRQPPLPKLSKFTRGWTAPQDQPYIPVGNFTEILSAMDAIKQQLPHTDPRYNKETYRAIMQLKKEQRDFLDQVKESYEKVHSKKTIANLLKIEEEIENIKR